MSTRAPKPFGASPLPDISDSLSNGQIGWWLANEGAGAVKNIANPALFNGTAQAGVTRGVSDWGRELVGNGAANSYVDLGVAKLIDQATPFTFSWMERAGTSPLAYSGVATFLPISATQRWFLFRDDTDVNFRYMSCGLANTAMNQFLNAPTLASGVGITRHFILLGLKGMQGAPATNAYILIVDGVGISGAGTTSGGVPGSLTSNLNLLGWDGADSNYKGGYQNFRLWNRVLGSTELNRLILNPFAGASVRKVFAASSVVTGNHSSMFLAM